MSSAAAEQDIQPQHLNSSPTSIMVEPLATVGIEEPPENSDIKTESFSQPVADSEVHMVTTESQLPKRDDHSRLNDSNTIDNTVMPIKRPKSSETETVPEFIEDTKLQVVHNQNTAQPEGTTMCKIPINTTSKEEAELLGSDSCVPDQKPGTSSSQPGSPKNQQTSDLSDLSCNSAYHIKWIEWKEHKTPIITQNENGPCPLIAIMNVLILKNRITLPPMMEIITAEQLMEYLGDCILDSVPKNIPEGAQLNYEQNMHDAMAILPKLQTGLDVNVKFTGVSDFEYTPECIVFDLLHIPLYHGWLVDPQSPEIQAAVGNHSYNQLVEKIVNNKCRSQTELVTEALIAEAFLEKTASQLTYHGLCELTTSLQDEELAVLFRNNHFITMYKRQKELFQLVTDQGFLTESNVVWETLNNIEGDGQFVDCNFVTVPPKPPPLPSTISTAQQIDQDYMVALTLQEENQKLQQKDWEWEQYKQKSLGVKEPLSDEDLARRLQEEENRYANAAGQERPRPQMSPAAPAAPRAVDTNSGSRSRSRDCTIL